MNFNKRSIQGRLDGSATQNRYGLDVRSQQPNPLSVRGKRVSKQRAKDFKPSRKSTNRSGIKLAPQINFKKILARKDVGNLLENITRNLDTNLCIKDSSGQFLIGTEADDFGHAYSIKLAGDVVGWAIGTDVAATVAAVLSYAVKQEFEKRSLGDELLEKYEEIDLFQDLSTQITASLDLQEVAHWLTQEAGELLESSSSSILLLDRETGELGILSQFGEVCHVQAPLLVGDGIVGNIVQRGRGEIVNNVPSDPRCTERDRHINALICAPLIVKEQTIGAILLSSDSNTQYTTKDLKLLNLFAAQAAIAIEKARLYQQSCAEAERAQNQVRRLQRTFYSWQQTLVAGIAHEINNPANFIYGNLSHAKGYMQDLLDLLQLYQTTYPQTTPEIQAQAEACELEFLMEDLPQVLSSMDTGVKRINEAIGALRNFSQVDRAEMKLANLHDGIDSTLMILNNRLKVKGQVGVEIIKDYGELPPVACYAGQLNQVFMNLLSNAIDALEEGRDLLPSSPSPSVLQPSPSILCPPTASPSPQIHIRTEVQDDRWAVVRIADNGPGMTDEVQRRLFDTFFTTKAVGKGTGLGLAISHQIVVEKHGGILRCQSQLGEGTEFWIQIPLEPQAETCQSPSLILGS